MMTGPQAVQHWRLHDDDRCPGCSAPAILDIFCLHDCFSRVTLYSTRRAQDCPQLCRGHVDVDTHAATHVLSLGILDRANIGHHQLRSRHVRPHVFFKGWLVFVCQLGDALGKLLGEMLSILS